MENVKKMEMEFSEAFPDVFYKPIQTNVVTMEVLKKDVTVGTHTMYDRENQLIQN